MKSIENTAVTRNELLERLITDLSISYGALGVLATQELDVAPFFNVPVLIGLTLDIPSLARQRC